MRRYTSQFDFDFDDDDPLDASLRDNAYEGLDEAPYEREKGDLVL